MCTAEIIDHHVAEVIGQQAWNQLEPFMVRALAGEQVIYELNLALPSGDKRWVSGSYTPDRNETGAVQGFMVHVVDIEKRKQAYPP